MTNIGTLTAKLSMDASQFNSQLSAAEKQLQSTQNKIGLLSAALTGAFVAGIGAAVKDTMDFEHAISTVGAISQATGQQLDGLRQTAIRVGADTQYSANEAAGAMQDLAANGISATDIMNGAADAAASLAAAGGTDLRTAADTVSTAMAVWGQNTSSLTRDVNELAGAANVSRFGVEDMSLAIAAGGGAASAAGVDFDDFSTSIAAVAPYFSSGRTAGTAFKVFLTDLTPTSNSAADAMKQLGIITQDGSNRFFDASGKMKSMAEISQILHDALGPLSDAQRTQAASTIFGTEAMTTAIALSKQTDASYQQLQDTMANTSAADVAAQRMDNAAGSFEQLKGSVESAAITMGERLQPALKATFDGLTNVANGFTNMGGADQTFLVSMAGLAVSAPAAAIGIGKLVKAVGPLGDFLKTGAGKVTALSLGIAAVGTAAEVIVQKTTGHGLLEWIFGDPKAADAANRFLTEADIRIKELGKDSTIPTLTEQIQKYNDGLSTVAKSVQEVGNVQNEAKDIIQGVIERIGGQQAAYEDLLAVRKALTPAEQDYFDKLVDWTTQTQYHTEAVAKEAVAYVAAQGPIGILKSLLGDTADAHNNAAAAAADDMSAVDQYVDAITGAKDEAKALTDAINGLATSYSDLDPTVLSLNAKIADLDVQIAQVKAQGGDTSALDKLRQSYVDQRDAAASYGQALTPLITNIEHLPGAADDTGARLAALGQQMDDMNVPASDAYGVFSKLNQALDDTDASTAIDELGKLKDKMNPDLWATAADAIGPEIIDKITTGISDPVEQGKLLLEASQLGIDVSDAIENGVSPLTIGANIAAGVAEGIRSGKSGTVEAASEYIAGINNYFFERLGINSPSKVMRDEVGMPITQGIAAGILAAMPELDKVVDDAGAKIEDGFKEHAKTAAETFADALTTSIQNANLADEFGDEGAKIIETFEDALTNPTSAAKLPDMIVSLIQEMQDAGVPNAEALGDALGAAIVAGLNGQANNIGGAIKDITDAIGTTGALTVDSFNSAVTDAITKANLDDAIGREGTAIVDALNTALKDGGQKNINTLATDVANLQSTLNTSLPPGQAAYLGTNIMSALQTAIATGTPDAIAALNKALTDANTVLQGGAVNIQTGAVTSADAVAKLADSLGVSKDFIVSNINTLVATGLDTLAGKLGMLPDSTQAAIDKTMDAWASGKISMQAAITQLGVELPPDIVAALKAAADAATPVASSIGQGIGSAITAGIKDGVGTDITKDVVIGGISTSSANDILDKGKSGAERFEDILGFNPLDLTQGYLTSGTGRNLTISDIQALNIGGSNGIIDALNSGALVAHAGAPATEAAAMNLIGGGVGGYVKNGVVYTPDGKAVFNVSDWATMASTAVPNIPSYDVGTSYVPRDGLAYLHRGEAVVPAAQNNGGDGPVFNISVDARGAADPDSVVRTLKRELPGIFEDYWRREAALAGVR